MNTFWAVLMCFSTQCIQVPAPSEQACYSVLPALREYAHRRQIPVEVDCVNNKQYA